MFFRNRWNCLICFQAPRSNFMHRSTRSQAHCAITDSADKFQAVLVLHIKPKIEPNSKERTPFWFRYHWSFLTFLKGKVHNKYDFWAYKLSIMIQKRTAKGFVLIWRLCHTKILSAINAYTVSDCQSSGMRHANDMQLRCMYCIISFM